MGSIFNQFAQGSAAGQKAYDNRFLRDQQKSDLRKKANFEDVRVGRQMLEAKNFQGFLDLASNRIDTIESEGGDSSDTRYLLQAFNAGDIDGILSGLRTAEEEGITTTDSQGNSFLKDLVPKSNTSTHGKYIPRDYTIDSWSEFAKSGDPSILTRYEGETKERTMALKEEVQLIKKEKFELKKKADESEKNKKEIVAALKKKDTDRAKFLEVVEGKNAISNIDSLLSGDLDLIYGGMEWAYPDSLRSQTGKNMLAKRNQIGSTMSLMAAGKLKGQGTITDPEREMLAEAATVLKNEDISPVQAIAELNRIRPIFEYFVSGDTSDSDENAILSKYGL